jgi:hypothetical protein
MVYFFLTIQIVLMTHGSVLELNGKIHAIWRGSNLILDAGRIEGRVPLGTQ